MEDSLEFLAGGGLMEDRSHSLIVAGAVGVDIP